MSKFAPIYGRYNHSDIDDSDSSSLESFVIVGEAAAKGHGDGSIKQPPRSQSLSPRKRKLLRKPSSSSSGSEAEGTTKQHKGAIVKTKKPSIRRLRRDQSSGSSDENQDNAQVPATRHLTRRLRRKSSSSEEERQKVRRGRRLRRKSSSSEELKSSQSNHKVAQPEHIDHLLSSNSEDDIIVATQDSTRRSQRKQESQTQRAIRLFSQCKNDSKVRQKVRDGTNDSTEEYEDEDDEELDTFVVPDNVNDEDQINCVCGCTVSGDYGGLWVQCSNDLCTYWQHAACYGYRTREEIPETFLCTKCQLAHGVGTRNKGLKMEELQSKVLAAVEEGNANLVKQLVQSNKHFDINVVLVEDRTKTLLLRAAEFGYVDVIMCLIKLGADVLWFDLDNHLALSHALLGNHVGVVRYLLNIMKWKALKKRTKGEFHKIILQMVFYAAAAPNDDNLKLLLDLREFRNIVSADNLGVTALHYSCENGSLDCFNLLLKHGANPKVVCHDGSTLLHYAARGGNVKLVYKVAPLVKRFQRDENGMTALFPAVEVGDVATVEALHQLGLDLYNVDHYGTSLLHLAALNGHTEVVKFLIKCKHPVDCLDNKGWPPILYANFNTNRECVLALMEPKPQQLTILGDLLRASSHESQSEFEKAKLIVRSTIEAIATEDAYYSCLNNFIRKHYWLLDDSFSFMLRKNGLLDLQNKSLWVNRQITKLRNETQPGFHEMTISRFDVFETAYNYMFQITPEDFRNPSRISVTFGNEPGICLGPKREFLTTFSNEILDNDRHFFEQCENEPSVIMPKMLRFESDGSEQHGRITQFEFIGQIVGFAIASNEHIHLPLSRVLWKVLTNTPLLHPDDLQFVDPMVMNSIQWVLDNTADGLDLTFSKDVTTADGVKSVPLDPTLKYQVDTPVTDSNKSEYATLLSRFILETTIEKEVKALCEGLWSVIPRSILEIYKPEELSLVVNGVTQIDINDWKNHTRYNGYLSSDPVIRWYWEVVEALPQSEQLLLLQFTTGVSSVPVSGFAGLVALNQDCGGTSIYRAGGKAMLPTASTCFNMLKLPPYPSKEVLRTKLLIAIRYGSKGFAFS